MTTSRAEKSCKLCVGESCAAAAQPAEDETDLHDSRRGTNIPASCCDSAAAATRIGLPAWSHTLHGYKTLRVTPERNNEGSTARHWSSGEA